MSLLGRALRLLAAPPAGWEAPGRLYTAASPGPDEPAGPVLRVLCWNVAYGYGLGSEAYHYAPRAKQAFEERLTRVAAVIRRADAGVVLLQETDFYAQRSHGENQLARLMKASGYGYGAGAVSWACRYVPYPALDVRRHVGRIVSGGGVLSRWRITGNAVTHHPQPPEKPDWYNAFYLKRYSQVVTVERGGRSLAFVNAHLEDTDAGNRLAQAREMGALARRHGALVAGGDLNAGTGDGALAALREASGLRDAFIAAHGAEAGDGFRTFPSVAPAVRLDHLLVSEAAGVESVRVVTEAGDASDHLPVLLELRLNSPSSTP